MIRLIISDIDGTLVPEGSTTINPEYLEVIRALTDRGIQFAAASGRQASSIDAVFHEIKDLIYYLGDNGAYIQKCGVPAKEIRMRPEDTCELLDDAGQIPDCFPLMSTKDGFYTDTQNKDFHHLVFDVYKGTGAVVKDLKECVEPCIKMSLYREKGSREVYERLYDKWKDRLAVNISGATWVDFNAFASTKGNAVRWIQESEGITPEETVVFGDNFNDISMLERAGRSYASVLSHPDVKKAAKFEVASYQEDGVLQVLKQILEEAEHEK